MSGSRKTYPVPSVLWEDHEDDFPRRRRKRGWFSWVKDDEVDIAKRIVASVVVLAIGTYIIKLNERIAILEMKFAIFEVRHEMKGSANLIDDKSTDTWATPELGIVPNFVKDYFGVQPLPPMNRKRPKR